MENPQMRNGEMTRAVHAVRVLNEEWTARLRDLGSADTLFLHEGPSRESEARVFIEAAGTPAQVFLLPTDSRLFFFQDFHDQITKDSALAAVLGHVDRFSVLAREKQRILLVLEELLLNATISAPRAAAERGLFAGDSKCRLRVEWNEENLWIHVSDPYGAFLRANFEISFRPSGDGAESHGHSGRGLQIIFDRSQDLWIRSRPGWGTLVSCRLPLIRRGVVNRTFLADFP